MKKIHVLVTAYALASGMTLPACALATERPDIVAGLNTLPLLTSKLSGDIVMAVIYDPADPASTADAEGIKKIVDAGVEVPGGGKLSAILVGVGELGKLSRTQISFLTPGLAAYFTDINTATSAASILTITTDLDCVRNAKCIIGVATKPNLTIYYSKSAADAAKIEFLQEFSMLVKRL